jgi:hypothetical protein
MIRHLATDNLPIPLLGKEGSSGRSFPVLAKEGVRERSRPERG